MSERVANVEIEDVLSSIKRLVSSGNKADDTHKPAEDAPAPQPEKFVLTPALRVMDDESLVESVRQTPAEDDVWTSGDLAKFDDDAALVLNTAADVPSAPEAVDRHSLEATIAELEAAVTAQPDEWEPDGSEVKTVPTWETVSYPALDDVEDAVAVEEESGVLEPDTTAEFVVTDVIPDAIPDDIARIGLTFSHAQDLVEPEQADDDTDYGDELTPDVAKPGDDEDLESYIFGEGSVVDEALLRKVVLDIVRDELQGKMGERITRNVRKMVRREIHRVLTTQEFD